MKAFLNWILIMRETPFHIDSICEIFFDPFAMFYSQPIIFIHGSAFASTLQISLAKFEIKKGFLWVIGAKCRAFAAYWMKARRRSRWRSGRRTFWFYGQKRNHTGRSSSCSFIFPAHLNAEILLHISTLLLVFLVAVIDLFIFVRFTIEFIA